VYYVLLGAVANVIWLAWAVLPVIVLYDLATPSQPCKAKRDRHDAACLARPCMALLGFDFFADETTKISWNPYWGDR
jgi:hypothetical protein